MKRLTRRQLLLLPLLLLTLCLQAQIPNGYYNGAKGRSGKSLKTALAAIISDHTARSYDALWTDMQSTDARPDGKVWDMYSSITNFTFGKDQAGNYKKEGDVYNREHSFPKSWFDDAKPMYTDLFHLVPTDGYVNGRRSNYPYGETNNPTWTSAGGFSKLGPCSLPGYSGTVFEPNDEYKGDLARNYFYMATAYEDKIAGWSSPMLAGNSYPAYTEWAITMLLRWAKEDPVSEKEIARNNAVYAIQHNRNPYIDYPGLEQLVWGTKTSTPFDPDNYEGGGTVSPDPDPVAPEAPTFSPAQGQVEAGTVVTIDCATTGAYIYYSVNGEPETAGYPPVKVTISDRTEIQARSMLGERSSAMVKAVYTLPSQTPEGDGVYYPISSTSDLAVGASYLVVCVSHNTALGAVGGTSNDIRSSVEIALNEDGTLTTETGGTGLPYVLTLGGTTGAYTLYDAANGGYLSLTGSANKLYLSTTAENDSELWDITFGSEGVAYITNVKYDTRHIQYNASSPRFACYTGSQREVVLFRQHVADGIESVNATATAPLDVYSMDGRLVRRGATSVREAAQGLPAGIYVIGGKRIVVK